MRRKRPKPWTEGPRLSRSLTPLGNAHLDVQAGRHGHVDQRVQPEEDDLAAHQVGYARLRHAVVRIAAPLHLGRSEMVPERLLTF
jgi:hypothetical protein